MANPPSPLDTTWASVPGYPNYQCRYGTLGGYKVRSKKRPRPGSQQPMGGKHLVSSGGKVRLTHSSGRIDRRSLVSIWDATFKGTGFPQRQGLG